MEKGHWIMLGLTAAWLTALWRISAVSSPHSRGSRWTQRILWTGTLLWISGALGGIGLNGANLIASTLLGLPGYAALWAISKMRG